MPAELWFVLLHAVVADWAILALFQSIMHKEEEELVDNHVGSELVRKKRDDLYEQVKVRSNEALIMQRV
jgi:hypothetical protein